MEQKDKIKEELIEEINLLKERIAELETADRERKKIEAALQKSEDRQRGLMLSMADWVWEVDENGVYTYSSHVVNDLLGRSSEEIIGKTPFDFMAPDEAKRVAAIFSEIAANKSPIKDLENWNVGKNGEKICLLTNAVPLLNENGDLKGYLGVDKNITDRKKAEAEINNSQKWLQRIIDLLPIRIFWKDKNLSYLGCNKIFAKDAGKDSPADLIGKDDFQMVWKDQAESYRADDQEVLRSREVKLNFEEPQTTPKGDKIWLKTSKVPLMDSDGNEIGILGTYEDITERKKMEQEFHQRLKELELFQKVSIGREAKMIELKKELKNLKDQRSQLKSPPSSRT